MTDSGEPQSAASLEELRRQITDYYETYYAELRTRLGDHSTNLAANVPDSFKGYRRVVTVLGKDGVVITHWPAGQDSFEFHLSPQKTAKELAAEECAGEEIIDYEEGSDFGVYEISEPLQLVVDGQVVWKAGWVKMEISSRLDIWRSRDLARKAVEEDLRPYLEAQSSQS